MKIIDIWIRLGLVSLLRLISLSILTFLFYMLQRDDTNKMNSIKTELTSQQFNKLNENSAGGQRIEI